MRVAILAVQGAFIEHRKKLELLGAECIELRKKEDLEKQAAELAKQQTIQNTTNENPQNL